MAEIVGLNEQESGGPGSGGANSSGATIRKSTVASAVLVADYRLVFYATPSYELHYIISGDNELYVEKPVYENKPVTLDGSTPLKLNEQNTQLSATSYYVYGTYRVHVYFNDPDDVLREIYVDIQRQVDNLTFQVGKFDAKKVKLDPKTHVAAASDNNRIRVWYIAADASDENTNVGWADTTYYDWKTLEIFFK